jgi:hypothetical protein
VLVFAIIAAIVVAVIAAAYVLWPRYNDWATRCHDFLPPLAISEVGRVLRANVDKRLRITFTDGVIQTVDISSVDDEGFLHSGPDGIDSAAYWTQFESVAGLQAADFSSSSEIDAIVELIFEPNESPFFIDATAPLEDIVRAPDTFKQRASARFGRKIEMEDLRLTVPEFVKLLKGEQHWR